MRTCPECKITVGGAAKTCPLCGAELTLSGTEAEGDNLYPEFTGKVLHRSSFPFLAKIFAFITLIAVGTCILIDLLVTHRLSWSLYVIGSFAVLWTTVGTHLLGRVNLNYLLLNDLVAVSLFLVLIDLLSGWNRWSIDYVIPILYVGIMITTVVLALVFRMYWREYMLSLVAVCALGVGPLLIFLSSSSPIRFLCLGAALLAAALLIGLLFFASGKLFSEWRRRMNL